MSAAAAPGAPAPSLEVEGGRATIRLRRPDKRNRIEPADLVALAGHLGAVDADPTVRVLTLEAEGTSWCSGFHLGALAKSERPTVSFGDVCDRLEGLRVPTIAVLQGHVHGGGTDLAVACDLRVGVHGLVLGMPAARIGLQYYASGLRRFVERIGPDATKRLFLTAETVPAEELLRLGYLHELVAPEALAGRAAELTGAVAALAPLAVARTKAAINLLARGGPSASDLEAIEAGHRDTLRSQDHREGLAAVREGRPARFEGC
ncbi:MAG: enoyl-CoA hydratase/isomerase family protein [Acidimicrobiia bacterium]|nr:enoyl-CoA hydratase/isomerase family protein [Acidimicrobiia bacterium]